jgi:Tfp pilus assembly protein PilN
METSLATLLLIASAVILTCIVIDYAVSVVQTTIQIKESPQMGKLLDLENKLMNQTDSLLNQTMTQTPEPLQP